MDREGIQVCKSVKVLATVRGKVCVL